MHLNNDISKGVFTLLCSVCPMPILLTGQRPEYNYIDDTTAVAIK